MVERLAEEIQEFKLVKTNQNFSNVIGAAVMGFFSFYAAYRWYSTGLIFFALLLIRDIALVYFFLVREDSKSKGVSNSQKLLAYISSSIPLLYLQPSLLHVLEIQLTSNILFILGFSISTLALFDLGRSFGVSPKNRGFVDDGLYRYLRHPMYIGYSISELGFVILNPMNLGLYFISITLYFYRGKTELRILGVGR